MFRTPADELEDRLEAPGSRYRSGDADYPFKNPAAPAVSREAEEDWGR